MSAFSKDIVEVDDQGPSLYLVHELLPASKTYYRASENSFQVPVPVELGLENDSPQRSQNLETSTLNSNAEICAPVVAVESSRSNHSPYSPGKTSSSLAPAGLLHSEAITGDFSLRNVFRVPGTATTTKQPHRSTIQHVINRSSDPIVLNIVSMPIARNLFDS